MEVLDILKLKLKPTEDELPTIELAIEEVGVEIKNYCNIDKVPEALKFTWANMVEDLIRYRKALDADTSVSLETISIGDVSSLKIGDTTISLGKQDSNDLYSKAIKSHDVNLDDIIFNYRAQLNKFRRMVW